MLLSYPCIHGLHLPSIFYQLPLKPFRHSSVLRRAAIASGDFPRTYPRVVALMRRHVCYCVNRNMYPT